MSLVYEAVSPGDRWTTYRPGPDEGMPMEYCETPRCEGRNSPFYSVQVFTRGEGDASQLVAFWATCQECHDMMHAQAAEVENGGKNATPDAG